MIYQTETEFKEVFELETGIIFSRRAWEIIWYLFTMCGYGTPLDDADLMGCIEIWKKARQIE